MAESILIEKEIRDDLSEIKELVKQIESKNDAQIG